MGARSAGVVRGTMRSTMLQGKVQREAIQSASAASPLAAASTLPRSTPPLAGRLSSDISVIGASAREQRKARPCTIRATALPGTALG